MVGLLVVVLAGSNSSLATTEALCDLAWRPAFSSHLALPGLGWQAAEDDRSPRMENALVHVVEARYPGGHRVWLRFDDGVEGDVDLADALRGPVFEPLKDPRRFAEFRVDLTLTWPNGADLAPESLHARVLRARG